MNHHTGVEREIWDMGQIVEDPRGKGRIGNGLANSDIRVTIKVVLHITRAVPSSMDFSYRTVFEDIMSISNLVKEMDFILR
jgi:hypothetical protein